jgi:predicted nucleotidyltransferase
MAIPNVESARRHYREREAQRREEREPERWHWLQRVREAASRIAAQTAGVNQVAVFGSLVQPGRFRSDSDIDAAVECDTVEAESAFWQALERELERDVDVRPLTDALVEAMGDQGESVYSREDADSGERLLSYPTTTAVGDE